jgi:peptidoglycan hydrolase-like protein with peptidoglycan-binding domain
MQRFLFDRGFYRGPINGIFGPKTELGVKKFQAQYTKEILLPWNLTDPTGVWGRTTRAMANKFEGCNEGPVTLPNGVVTTF